MCWIMSISAHLTAIAHKFSSSPVSKKKKKTETETEIKIRLDSSWLSWKCNDVSKSNCDVSRCQLILIDFRITVERRLRIMAHGQMYELGRSEWQSEAATNYGTWKMNPSSDADTTTSDPNRWWIESNHSSRMDGVPANVFLSISVLISIPYNCDEKKRETYWAS